MTKTKLILIGLDGCDIKTLKLLADEGHLPTFSELLKNGCHGTLVSTLPPNSLPAWTSIFTGVNPGKHGITDFSIREKGELKIANSSYRMVDTLWTILNRSNLRQIVVNEPVTYPPQRLNGIMLAGFSAPPQSKNFAYPSAIKEEINKICQGYETDLPFEFEEIVIRDKTKGFELINKFATKIFRATEYLEINYDWDLLSVIFTSTDRLQHFYFHDLHYIRSHYKLLDGYINKILSAEPDANVIIVSDHGFKPLIRCFYINTWLKERNLAVENQSILNVLFSRIGLTYKKTASILMKIRLYKLLAKFSPKSIKHSLPLYKVDKSIDFKRSIIFSPGLNSGLFINKSINKNQILILKEKLSSLVVNGESPIERVYMRNEVMWGPYAYRAADIFLISKYGYEISPRLVPAHTSTPGTFGDIRTGTHRIKGVFLAYGPEISNGKKLKKPVFTWDITPTILHMFNLPLPSYMDGRVLKEIFRRGSVPARRLIVHQKVTISEKNRIKKVIKKLKGKIV